MKEIGFTIGLGYKFICDCGKELGLRIPSDTTPKIISHLYRQCENCSRTYKISFDSLFSIKEGEEQAFVDLFLSVNKLTLEVSRLSGLARVDLLE